MTVITVCCVHTHNHTLSSEDFVAPCGGCRQVLAEFGLDIEVIMIKSDKTYKSFFVRDLLPEAFAPENLN